MISKSFLISKCQICSSKNLTSKFFLGYHPTVNDFTKVGKINLFIEKYPLEILLCKNCSLVQLGVSIDGKKIFPKNYAYRSGTTKILIDNFEDLANETKKLQLLKINELIVDIKNEFSSFNSEWYLYKNILPKFTNVLPISL